MEEGGAVTVQKESVSFGQKRPRSRGEPSSRPASVRLPRLAQISIQVGQQPVRVQWCAQMQLVAALPAPVHASRTIGVGWVGRERRGRGASTFDSFFVASQGRHWAENQISPMEFLTKPQDGRGSSCGLRWALASRALLAQLLSKKSMWSTGRPTDLREVQRRARLHRFLRDLLGAFQKTSRIVSSPDLCVRPRAWSVAL